MFVKRYGCGPDAYVALHGWSGNHRTFEPLVPFLPRGASLYAADLPGCGASAPPRNWTLDEIASEIAAEFHAAGTPVTMIGNCIGAVFAMKIALDYPGFVQRLILIDAFALWPWYFRVFTAPVWGKYAYALTFANPVGRWVTNGALTSKRDGESNLTEGFARSDHHAARRYLGVLQEVESASEFESLRIPTEILFGARSFRAVRESAAIWKGIWPWARVWELEGAGHLPVREASASVSRVVFGEVACLA